jgi:Fe-S-cluster-containing hydrogenase component 2
MACLEACPFGAVSFDHEHETAIKCDLCGGDPKCAKFCRALPHLGRSALTYMTAEEWVRRKRDGISERRRKGEVA